MICMPLCLLDTTLHTACNMTASCQVHLISGTNQGTGVIPGLHSIAHSPLALFYTPNCTRLHIPSLPVNMIPLSLNGILLASITYTPKYPFNMLPSVLWVQFQVHLWVHSQVHSHTCSEGHFQYHSVAQSHPAGLYALKYVLKQLSRALPSTNSSALQIALNVTASLLDYNLQSLLSSQSNEHCRIPTHTHYWVTIKWTPRTPSCTLPVALEGILRAYLAPMILPGQQWISPDRNCPVQFGSSPRNIKYRIGPIPDAVQLDWSQSGLILHGVQGQGIFSGVLLFSWGKCISREQNI